MQYCKMKFNKILKELDSEEKARAWVWLAKFDGKIFSCPKCKYESFYQHKKYPEVRECKNCHFEVRLRAKTIFQSSKIPMLVWLRAICLLSQGKRGISALELQSELEMKSYGTAWIILHKIREALRQRDDEYKLNDIIELDGAVFGKRHTGNQKDVLVAVESKDWIDQKGRKKSKAGFAKVVVANETKEEAQKFVDKGIEQDSTIHSDRGPSLMYLENVKVEHRTVGSDKELLDNWLPWVHKFISNAKSWIIGTHHGVEAKYLAPYLSEYTFRFNRRHDPDSMFFRVLGACVKAAPKTSQVLFG
ncbi:MAG: IS1595 family transposase [Promethearchaeota archaeon]